ncbi:MAG: 3'-5' exonuclease, partial [Candidatus Lokiarchaeia archaeon]|nr:3'-5' exonuclease [Candidatus Lokiarchaeia archaeon]
METIGTYAIRLLLGENGKNRLVSEQVSIVLLKQCFNETGLKYFSSYKGIIPFGTLERVKNVISEYKRNGITTEKLRSESENLSGAEKIKAWDIANIYELYQKKFGELKIYEIGDVFKELNETNTESFETTFLKIYPDVSIIIINGFDEFTIPEIEIINLSAELKIIELYLYFDYYKYNPSIFSHLDSCYRNLENKGFKVIKDLSSVELTKYLTNLREYLFAGKTKKISLYDEQICELTAFKPENEVALIAKEIKKLILQENIDPNKICVVFNLIKPYSPIIRDQLTLFGIPYNLTDRFSLSTSAPVISIINLLEIIDNNFYYKNIFRAFSSEFSSLIGIDLNNLLKTSIELKVISGLENWKERLNHAIEEQKYGDNTEVEYKRYNVNYYRALEDIEKIHSFLKPFETRMTPIDFYQNLIKMINELNLHILVLNGLEDNIEIDIKAINTFIESTKELIDLLKLEYNSQKTFTLKFYLNELKTIASFSRYNIKEKPGYGVLVTTLNEIRGLQFDYLFVAGLNDGNLPTRFTPEIFFSGSFVREALSHQTEERYLFYQALCSWRKGLYLTHPQNDEKKELVESNFLIGFKKTFELNSKTFEDYNDIIFSKYFG